MQPESKTLQKAGRPRLSPESKEFDPGGISARAGRAAAEVKAAPARTVLDELAETSPHVWRGSLATFRRDDRDWEMPAYRFLGPKLDAPALRLAVFAGIAGDELEGIMGVTAFVTRLAANPALATGINLHLYPNCNPTGLDRQQRDTSAGLDLARQLWSGSRDAEAAHLTREIRRRRFHGWVTLHSHRRPDTFLVEAGADPASQALADDLSPAINTRLPAVVVNRSGSRCGFLRPPGGRGLPVYIEALRSPATASTPPASRHPGGVDPVVGSLQGGPRRLDLFSRRSRAESRGRGSLVTVHTRLPLFTSRLNFHSS